MCLPTLPLLPWNEASRLEEGSVALLSKGRDPSSSALFIDGPEKDGALKQTSHQNCQALNIESFMKK